VPVVPEAHLLHLWVHVDQILVLLCAVLLLELVAVEVVVAFIIIIVIMQIAAVVEPFKPLV
jgi:hypothetical protein